MGNAGGVKRQGLEVKIWGTEERDWDFFVRCCVLVNGFTGAMVVGDVIDLGEAGEMATEGGVGWVGVAGRAAGATGGGLGEVRGVAFAETEFTTTVLVVVGSVGGGAAAAEETRFFFLGVGDWTGNSPCAGAGLRSFGLGVGGGFRSASSSKV